MGENIERRKKMNDLKSNERQTEFLVECDCCEKVPVSCMPGEFIEYRHKCGFGGRFSYEELAMWERNKTWA